MNSGRTFGPRVFLIALLALIAVACTESFPPEFPVPEFSLTSPNTGMVADNSTIEGRPAVLYWFTSW
jgi:hypothetical protein